MMLNRFAPLLVLAFVVTALVAPAPAQAQTAGGGYKIGVVDVQEVVRDYEKRKAEYDKLEAEVKERQKKVDALSTEVEALQKQHTEMQESTRTRDQAYRDEMFELTNKIEERFGEYQTELKRLQREIDMMEADVLETVFTDVDTAIKEYANQNNYHLILNERGGPRGNILFSASGLDVTQDIVRKLNGK